MISADDLPVGDRIGDAFGGEDDDVVLRAKTETLGMREQARQSGSVPQLRPAMIESCGSEIVVILPASTLVLMQSALVGSTSTSSRAGREAN